MKIVKPFILASMLFPTLVYTNANVQAASDTTKTVSKTPLLDLWTDEAKSKSSNPKDTHYIYKKPNKGGFFKNVYSGYYFYYPYAWKIDTHQIPNYSRFYHYNFRLDVTMQDTAKIYTNNNTYIYKTVYPIKKNVTKDSTWKNSYGKFRLVEYKRPALEGISNDMNYYAYLFIEKGSVVYTFQMKSSETHYPQKRKDLLQIASTFRTMQPKTFNLKRDVLLSNPEISYSHSEHSLHIPKNSFMMGFYTTKTPDVDALSKKFKSDIGSQFFYKPINSNYDAYTRELLEKKRLPIVTFLLEESNNPQNPDILRDIIAGKFDKNILNWATEIKRLNGPVLIRFGNEMNGNWVQWSHKNNYNDPDLYKLAYRHFVDVFKENGTTNAYFVWNPNNTASPYYEWNHATLYYPGDNYVDWVGLTAYNFGNGAFSKFQYFDSLYRKLYDEYSRAFTSKPMLIGEFGSVEKGGSKAEFIDDFFRKIPNNYPNIKIALWFSAQHGSYDFRTGTSLSSTNAFAKNMKNTNVINRLK